jgi:hypothetical protein
LSASLELIGDEPIPELGIIGASTIVLVVCASAQSRSLTGRARHL